MNPTILIRTVAATLAAAALLTAQAAPAPAGKAGTERTTTTKASDRMQVRLAEVIAMLEEDDLSPEQRAQAKKKLQEIVARLRETPAAPVVPPTPSAPRIARVAVPDAGGAEVMVVPQEPTPPPPAPSAPAPRARGRGAAPVEVAPPQPAPPARSRTRVVAPVEVAPAAPQEPAGPTPPARPGKPKTTAPAKGEVLELVDVTEGEQGKPRRLRIVGHEGDEPVRLEAVELRWREAAEKALRADTAKLRTDLDAARVELEKARTEQAKAEKQGDLARARVRFQEAQAEAKRARDVEARVKRDVEAQVQQERARVYSVRERAAEEAEEARAQAPRVRGRVVGRQVEAADTTVIEVAPLRGGVRAAPAKVEADDDDERILRMVEDIRTEMRAIRKLLEQMRKQASQAKQVSGGGLMMGSSGQNAGSGLGSMRSEQTLRGSLGAGLGGGVGGSMGGGLGGFDGASSLRSATTPAKGQDGGSSEPRGLYGAGQALRGLHITGGAAGGATKPESVKVQYRKSDGMQ